MKPRSAKRKGTAGEKEVLADAKANGLEGHLQPLSGALQHWPHDVQLRTPSGSLEYNVEVKRRHGTKFNADDGPNQPKAFAKTLERWLGRANVLMGRADHSEWMCFMRASLFWEMNRYIHQLETKIEQMEAQDA